VYLYRMIATKNIKQKRIQIVALTLLQLFLFTFPLVVKTTHQHQNRLSNRQTTNGAELTKWEKPCAICQFEFDTVLKTETPLYSSIIPSQTGYISEYSSPVRSVAFTFISLRAPPLL